MLVLIVHPSKDGFIYVDSRSDDSIPKKILYYRDSQLPETHQIIDDIQEMAEYCAKRKIEQPEYSNILESATPSARPWLKWVLRAFCILIACTSVVLSVAVRRNEKLRAQQAIKTAQKEARQKVETAQKEAKEAQIRAEKAEGRAKEADYNVKKAKEKQSEIQAQLEKLQASQEASKKDLDEVKAKLDEAKKEKSSAELVAATARRLAEEMKGKAKTAVVNYSRLAEERKQWESYRENVKGKHAEYGKAVKGLCTAFIDGFKTKTDSVTLRFGEAKRGIPAIVKALTEDRNVVLNLVRNALDDQQGKKTDHSHLRSYIDSFLKSYSESCIQACNTLVNDGREYERSLQNRYAQYKSNIENCSNVFTSDTKTAINKQTASCQMPASKLPARIFEEDKEQIARTSEAIAGLVIKKRTGKKAIDDMKKLLEKHPGADDWQKTDVSKLQQELGKAVTKEMNEILAALQRDAVKHVSNAAENARDAYLKAGDDLTKAVTKKPK